MRYTNIGMLVFCLGSTGCVSLDGGRDVSSVKSNQPVEMTDSQLNSLKHAKNVVFIDSNVNEPNAMTQRDYGVGLSNVASLASFAGLTPREGVTTIVTEGSLKDNVERIAREYGWRDVHFEGKDFYVDKASVIESSNFEDAIFELVGDYPLLFCIDDTDKSVTLIRDNAVN